MSSYDPDQFLMVNPYHSFQQGSPLDLMFSQDYPLNSFQDDIGSPSGQQQQQQPSYDQPAEPAPETTQIKKSHPCPVAKQYNCKEFLTTSGHAARHAKKHTRKKDAICPECQKAFTRKDNMEQHRHTHSTIRAARKPAKDSRPDARSSEKAKRVQQKQARLTVSTGQSSSQMESSMVDDESSGSAQEVMYSSEENSPMQYGDYQTMCYSLPQYQTLMYQQPI